MRRSSALLDSGRRSRLDGVAAAEARAEAALRLQPVAQLLHHLDAERARQREVLRGDGIGWGAREHKHSISEAAPGSTACQVLWDRISTQQGGEACATSVMHLPSACRRLRVCSAS